MSIDMTRVLAVMRKEIREFRRNRFIIGTMALLPLIFLFVPLLGVFRISASASSSVVHAQVGSALLVMLIVPVIVPAAIAAYSVVGEREQGTLEPLLTTPVRREELLLGKGFAAIVPSVGITYLLFAIFVIGVHVDTTRRSSPTSGKRRFSSPSCCSRRCWQRGRSGSEWRSRPEQATCASPSSWGRWPAFPRSR
jgi:ABC-type transport system involved in multi-copper enzyme maturation permease subunit